MDNTSHSSMTTANSTLNPFEADSIESLHLTQFSPSVFAKSAATPASSKSASSFRWSIDHIAILHPADIDENVVQQESTLDSDTEERAQQAIDKFFSQQHVVPSPWSSVKRPVKHVTFSPNPPTISEAEDSVSFVEAPVRSPQRSANTAKHTERSEASCQTVVSLPIDFDLQALLGEQHIIEAEPEGEVNDLCSSTLRRKLFSHEEVSPIISPVAGGLALRPSPERIADIPSPQLSPIRQIDDTTLSASDISNVKTPGSVQSQFSSSPISSKQTPRRWTPYGQSSRGPVEGYIASPTLSPISSTLYPNASDSAHPRSNLSGMETAPSCDLLPPDASPILAEASSPPQVGMMSPFLASIAPSCVEMVPVSFSVLESLSPGCQRGGTNSEDVEDYPHLPSSDGPFISDSNDYNDHVDLIDSGGDSESSSPAAISMCSMEQSYFTLSSKGSDISPSSPRLDQNAVQDVVEDQINTREESLCFKEDMLSFNEGTGGSYKRQLTSTLSFPNHVSSDSGMLSVTTSSKTMASDSMHLTQSAIGSVVAKTTVVMDTVESYQRSRVIQRELATPMQSDSGFNSKSFTSMEVNDNEDANCMQTNEYSLHGITVGEKENLVTWTNQI